MKKNIRRYYQAWILRQQGMKLSEIANTMNFKSSENARYMIHYIDLKIESKQNKSTELKNLIQKYKKRIL